MADPASNMQLIQAVILLGAAVVMVPLFNRLGLGSVLGYRMRNRIDVGRS
ncbi:Kef-type K+ transport system membrane component KefB [Pseudoxanthomonas sacheonensis]|uniref:Kef-type K+ transport system membrane component KefB n=1 Tax=Pseudoxanthomonas sacheonensis TaxID=443615 RepID=A0ABU1RRE3_9GAMM|nr:Kef-type K+ transport system membrane component KefB [Pseudoxanthomonas sacheonensis]